MIKVNAEIGDHKFKSVELVRFSDQEIWEYLARVKEMEIKGLNMDWEEKAEMSKLNKRIELRILEELEYIVNSKLEDTGIEINIGDYSDIDYMEIFIE